jgi:hypothetical protein
MRVRAHLVASARRHLPCLAFACTRMRGDTIVWPELTQIGVKKKGLKIILVLLSPSARPNHGRSGNACRGRGRAQVMVRRRLRVHAPCVMLRSWSRCDHGCVSCGSRCPACCCLRRQPYVKALSGVLRGGTTISDAKGTIPPTINIHGDIGTVGFNSIVFASSGVTKPSASGECALQGIHKELALSRVEFERLKRAKFLEERKGKQVRFFRAAPLQ